MRIPLLTFVALLVLVGLSPTHSQTAAGRPSDFDAFWDSKLSALAQVPLDPVLTTGKFPAKQIPPGLVYSQFSLAVSASERVRGQFAYPDQPGKKFPARVIFQWAGIYPLTPGFVTDAAKEGWLTVNVYPHDQPFDEPAEFYKALSEGPLKHYWAQGADDRERSYFLRMFLGVRRALDYVKTHPAWDGRVLIVEGNSQGGAQALVAAALDPSVTAVLANVPAFCDLNGSEAGRPATFPPWLQQVEGRDPAALASAARYYDAVHFAARIQCPVLIAAGEKDTTCPAVGIQLAVNQLARPHGYLLMPGADHVGKKDTQAPFYRQAKIWREALRQGQPVPVPRP